VANLLADESFPLPVAQELRILGHDGLTLEELGRADQGLSIVCSLDADSAGQAQRISAVLKPEESLAGKLFRINRPG